MVIVLLLYLKPMLWVCHKYFLVLWLLLLLLQIWRTIKTKVTSVRSREANKQLNVHTQTPVLLLQPVKKKRAFSHIPFAEQLHLTKQFYLTLGFPIIPTPVVTLAITTFPLFMLYPCSFFHALAGARTTCTSNYIIIA